MASKAANFAFAEVDEFAAEEMAAQYPMELRPDTGNLEQLEPWCGKVCLWRGCVRHMHDGLPEVILIHRRLG